MRRILLLLSLAIVLALLGVAPATAGHYEQPVYRSAPVDLIGHQTWIGVKYWPYHDDNGKYRVVTTKTAWEVENHEIFGACYWSVVQHFDFHTGAWITDWVSPSRDDASGDSGWLWTGIPSGEQPTYYPGARIRVVNYFNFQIHGVWGYDAHISEPYDCP